VLHIGGDGIAKRAQAAHRDPSDQLDLVHCSGQAGVVIELGHFPQCSFPSVIRFVAMYGTFDVGELIDHIPHRDPVPVEAHDSPGQKLISRSVERCVRQGAVWVEGVFDSAAYGVIFVNELFERRDSTDAESKVQPVSTVVRP